MLNDWLISIVGGSISTIIGGVVVAILIEKIEKIKKVPQPKISAGNPNNSLDSLLKSIIDFLFWVWFSLCMLLFGAIAIFLTQLCLVGLSFHPLIFTFGLVLWIIGIGLDFILIVYLIGLPLIYKIWIDYQYSIESQESK